MNVFPGQKVITSGGSVVTVAYQRNGQVYGWYRGRPVPITVRTDAWGGEADMEMGCYA